MKHKLLSLALALTLCLGLTLPAAGASAGYRDIPSGHWSEESVLRATQLGLFEGVGDGLFGRGQPISRAAFVTAMVRLFGWKEVTPEPGVAFCRRLAEAGVKAVIATDISRDGTMQGTNMDLYRELLTIPGLEITASGGIAKMEELDTLQAMGCHAAILGKSVYTGAIDLAEAVRRFG